LDDTALVGDQEVVRGALVVEAHRGVAALVHVLHRVLHVLRVHGAIRVVVLRLLGGRRSGGQGNGTEQQDRKVSEVHRLSLVTEWGSGGSARASSRPARAPGPAAS